MKTVKDTSVYKAVIDASIVVKWFCDEVDTHKAEEILERIHTGKLTAYAPTLILYEVANALWKGKKFKKEEIENSLALIMDTPLQMFTLDRTLITSAIRFMTVYDLTFYDSVYAAIAYEYDAVLFTANPKDHKKIREVKVQTL